MLIEQLDAEPLHEDGDGAVAEGRIMFLMCPNVTDDCDQGEGGVFPWISRESQGLANKCRRKGPRSCTAFAILLSSWWHL